MILPMNMVILVFFHVLYSPCRTHVPMAARFMVAAGGLESGLNSAVNAAPLMIAPRWTGSCLIAGWWFGCHQFYFPINIGKFIIPIDFIFFRGVAQPPTRIVSQSLFDVFFFGFYLMFP